MSDSVVKLRIDSKEYDANIKRAGEALQQYFNKVKEGGGTLKYLDEGVLEAVQEMGKLGTQAKNVKGQLRELTQATTDMTVAYRALTDEERTSPIGEAMAQSIAQMTERAGDLRDAMGDVSASIQNAASDTQRFDQMAAAMQGMTAGFQTVTGAAKLMGIQVGDDVEVIAKLQAAMAVTSGFQTMQNLLQKQSALMQGINALQKEFNLLAKANPYVLLATAAAAVVAAYVAWTADARDAAKAQKALNEEIESTKNQLAQIDKDTDFSVGVAEAAGKSWKAIHELRLEAARTKLQLADMNYDKLAASGVASAEQMKKAAEMQQAAWDNVMKVLNEGTIHDIKMRNGGGRTSGRGGGGSSRQQTEEQMNSAKIETLTQEYIHATDERRQAIEKEIEVLQKRNNEIAKLKDMAHGKTFDAGQIGEVVVTGNKNRQYGRATEGNIGAVISNMQNELKNADIGSALYDNISEKLADANAYKNLMQKAIEAGMSDLVLDSSSIWKQIVNGENIEDSVWQGMVDKINEKLKELNIDPIQINFETGNVKKDVKALNKEWNAAANAISAVGSAMSQIEDPAAKVLGTIAQAVATMALSYAQAANSPAVTGTGWGWIAFAATGLAQMIASISAIKQATSGYAQGGIVKGNSYSGDNIYGGPDAMVNAGELVLTRAQQANLASNLEGSGGGFRDGQIVATIEGETIVLAAKRWKKRTGRSGENVSFKI
jgi:membrane protein implicated in regulation of membrane protease activity